MAFTFSCFVRKNMQFIKAYIFEGDYKHWDDEIAYTVTDFYKQFSLFPNTLYAHIDTFNDINKATLSNQKMKEKVENHSDEEKNTLTDCDESIFISSFVDEFYELFFQFSEALSPGFFLLEFNISKENSIDKFGNDPNDDDDWDNDFFPVLPKPKPTLAKTITK